MTTPRTLIIGWDGATFDLIDPWARAGDLPNLSRLMQEGTRGILHAYPNMNSAVAWSSIVTGCNPGKHGVFDFGDEVGLVSNTWHPTTGRDRQRDPFWRGLNAAGKCVGVVNVPITYPADSVNGFMISGMDTPGLANLAAAYPRGLIQELQAAGIDYILDVPKLKSFRRDAPYELPGVVRQMVEARTRAILHLMDRFPWDALMAVYIATDRMQHSFWGQSAVPPEPGTSPVARSWEPLRELYKLLDAHLGQLLAKAGPETNVLIISDHGFCQSWSKMRGLNELFTRLGWLTYRKARKSSLRGRLLKNALVYGRRYLPPRLQLILAQRFPEWRQQALSENNFGDFDWTQTQVFAHPHLGSVFVNLQGTWPHGIVPIADYEKLCEQVCQVIRSLKDPVSGRPLAVEVRRRNELYAGPYAHHAPDILIEWDRRLETTGIKWEGNGKTILVEWPKNRDSWSGTHHSEGVLIAHGPWIRQGASLGHVTQYDIAPTVLYLQGQAIPEDVDGRVLVELLNQKVLDTYPITMAASLPSSSDVPVAQLNASEEAQIESRLRDLGYIE